MYSICAQNDCLCNLCHFKNWNYHLQNVTQIYEIYVHIYVLSKALANVNSMYVYINVFHLVKHHFILSTHLDVYEHSGYYIIFVCQINIFLTRPAVNIAVNKIDI